MSLVLQPICIQKCSNSCINFLLVKKNVCSRICGMMALIHINELLFVAIVIIFFCYPWQDVSRVSCLFSCLSATVFDGFDLSTAFSQKIGVFWFYAQ